jgi:hypothetical protein
MAAFLEPEVLIVDEALSVGDAAFRHSDRMPHAVRRMRGSSMPSSKTAAHFCSSATPADYSARFVSAASISKVGASLLMA